MENQRQVVTADQVRTWCANPDTQVIVKPVIDLNEHIHVEGYEVPARLREQSGAARPQAGSRKSRNTVVFVVLDQYLLEYFRGSAEAVPFAWS